MKLPQRLHKEAVIAKAQPMPDSPKWIQFNERIEEAEAGVFPGEIKTGRHLGRRDMEILTNTIRGIMEFNERVRARPESQYNPMLDYLLNT